jgi:hypothetical protein
VSSKSVISSFALPAAKLPAGKVIIAALRGMKVDREVASVPAMVTGSGPVDGQIRKISRMILAIAAPQLTRKKRITIFSRQFPCG